MAFLNPGTCTAWLVAAALLPGPLARAVPATTPPLEQAIKASYITKFAPFVEWPASVFTGPGGSFTICVAGRDPFGPTIDEVALGQKVKGRALRVRRVGDAVPLGSCQILVVGAGPADGIFAQVAGQPVLTIADRTAGVEGGMIRFVRQAGRVRFEIDNASARGAHLLISSKLLGLAVTVNK